MGNQILLSHNIVLHLASCMVRLLWEVSLTRVIVLLFRVLVLNVMGGVMMRVLVVVNTSVFIQIIVIGIAHGVIKVVEIGSVILLEVVGSFLLNLAFLLFLLPFPLVFLFLCLKDRFSNLALVMSIKLFFRHVGVLCLEVSELPFVLLLLLTLFKLFFCLLLVKLFLLRSLIRGLDWGEARSRVLELSVFL